MTIGKCSLWKYQTCSTNIRPNCCIMLKKKLLLSRNLSQECHVNEKTMLQISNVFRVTSMSIERFVKKYKYIFQYKVDAWSYYFSLYNTYLVNITVNLQLGCMASTHLNSEHILRSELGCVVVQPNSEHAHTRILNIHTPKIWTCYSAHQNMPL